jgi:hypothetical protein
MKSYAELRAMLARMEAAHAETAPPCRHRTADRSARRAHDDEQPRQGRQCGHRRLRHLDARRRADFQANVATLRFRAARRDRRADRKLARQAGAIAAFRVRHRSNEPERESVS